MRQVKCRQGVAKNTVDGSAQVQSTGKSVSQKNNPTDFTGLFLRRVKELIDFAGTKITVSGVGGGLNEIGCIGKPRADFGPLYLFFGS